MSRKKGRYFKVTLFNKSEYMVPKNIYDTRNQLQYFGLSHLNQLLALDKEIQLKYKGPLGN